MAKNTPNGEQSNTAQGPQQLEGVVQVPVAADQVVAMPTVEVMPAVPQPEVAADVSAVQAPELTPDAISEIPPALQETPADPAAEQQTVGFRRKTATAQIPLPQNKSAALKEVESVLTENLTEIYQSMTPQEQIAFRQKGEEVAKTIEGLVVTFRATTRKVLDLIRGWLAMIPRVNRYFLEQESKIKTDDVMQLQKKLKKERKQRVDIV